MKIASSVGPTYTIGYRSLLTELTTFAIETKTSMA